MNQHAAEPNLPELPRENNLRPWIIATLVIMVVAVLVRSALIFRHSLLPGTDAAYYPMQAQWLILHGELSLPAMPLTFYLQAFLAKTIMAISGMSLENAVSLSARLFDGCVEPLAAIPIMLLGFRWSSGRRSAIWLCGAAAVLSVLSPPIIRMAGDLQKNSLGMMWMAVSIWAMRESLACPRSKWRWARLAIVFVLAGVSHIGAFGVTGVILVGSLLSYAAISGRFQPTRKNAVIVSQVVLAVAVMTLFVAWLVPSQVQRIGTTATRVFGFSAAALVLSVAIYAVLAWLLRRLWHLGDVVPRCDLAIAIGTAFGLAILVAPVYTGVWTMRFLLMTAVPGAVLLSLLATKLRWDAEPMWRQKAILTVTGLLALASPMAAQGPVISEATANELRQLRDRIEHPETTMIVAPHGMEFWAGYLMRTRVKNGSLPRDTSSYDRILLLEPSEAASRQRPQPQHFPGPRGRRMDRVDERRPPTQEHQLVVPPTAKVIYKSQLFTLYEMPKN